jgi:hypothetical protein
VPEDAAPNAPPAKAPGQVATAEGIRENAGARGRGAPLDRERDALRHPRAPRLVGGRSQG